MKKRLEIESCFINNQVSITMITHLFRWSLLYQHTFDCAIAKQSWRLMNVVL